MLGHEVFSDWLAWTCMCSSCASSDENPEWQARVSRLRTCQDQVDDYGWLDVAEN